MGITKKPVKKNASIFPDMRSADAIAKTCGGIAERVQEGIEYKERIVFLADIRLNPDNEIFRDMDEAEDIITLAEDIKRNGLLHNLVVFPSTEEGQPVYVLISGERRFRALQHLAQNDDKYKSVDCKVIVTPLSPNEKKVLLFSANLQVRGGFGDEKIRRKAVTEFVELLQKEPYNLSPADAKAENDLDPALLELLDDKFLLRREADGYLRLLPEYQRLAASRFAELKAIEEPELANERERVRRAFRDKLLAVPTGATPAESQPVLQDALDYADAEIERLKNAQKNRESVALEKNRSALARNAITKNIPDTTKKVMKLLGRKNIQKAIAARPVEVREEAYNELKDLRDAVDKLMEIIANTQNQ